MTELTISTYPWETTDARDLLEELALRKQDYQDACKTIADMHAAAVGEVTGSRRGVVEDVEDLKEERDRLMRAGNIMAGALRSICHPSGPAPSEHDFNLAVDWSKGFVSGEGRCPRCGVRPLWPIPDGLRCDACGWEGKQVLAGGEVE